MDNLFFTRLYRWNLFFSCLIVFVIYSIKLLYDEYFSATIPVAHTWWKAHSNIIVRTFTEFIPQISLNILFSYTKLNVVFSITSISCWFSNPSPLLGWHMLAVTEVAGPTFPNQNPSFSKMRERAKITSEVHSWGR